MRIMWESKYGNTVEEIAYANITPCGYNIDKEPHKGHLFIELYRQGDTQETCISGEYRLDGKKTTYNKAMENWKKVSDQLFEKGYCKDSDFENVEWA